MVGAARDVCCYLISTAITIIVRPLETREPQWSNFHLSRRAEKRRSRLFDSSNRNIHSASELNAHLIIKMHRLLSESFSHSSSSPRSFLFFFFPPRSDGGTGTGVCATSTAVWWWDASRVKEKTQRACFEYRRCGKIIHLQLTETSAWDGGSTSWASNERHPADDDDAVRRKK